jgi:hypothetical protein
VFESFERAFQIDLVPQIADALRREFGPDIDVHPGGAGAEAGAVSRSFRASTGIILKTMALPSGDLRSLMTWVLRRTARDRLLEFGAPGAATETVLDSEPTLGDSWLAYLVLAPGSVLEDVLSSM